MRPAHEHWLPSFGDVLDVVAFRRREHVKGEWLSGVDVGGFNHQSGSQHAFDDFQGAVPWTAMCVIAIRMFASASKTDVPFLPSVVFAQVPARYWKTPDAVLRGFLAFQRNPDSQRAIASGIVGSMSKEAA